MIDVVFTDSKAMPACSGAWMMEETILFGPRKRKADALRIIIVGCGKVGHTLTEQLVREGHDITVVDTDDRVLEMLNESFDVMTVNGNGASRQVLERAGLREANMMIAVTGSDELNMLCCTIAKKAGGWLSAIARVRNPDYSEEMTYLRQQLGLSMIINPEMEAAREIARVIARPQALSVSAFAKGQAELVRFIIPRGNPLCGLSVMEMNRLFSFGFLACAVERDGIVTIPDGSFVLEEGDDLSLLAASNDAHRIFPSIGMRAQHTRNCLIIGGGRATYYLARKLIEQHVEVRIIEQNRRRCDELTQLLPEATVIYGDGTDETLLREEGLETIDAFVPLTDVDEENILLTLYAQRVSQAKTITKINRITFNNVIDSLQLGSVIYPKYITAELIIAYVRARQNSIGSNVETLYHLFDNRVEVIEFHVEKDAPVIGIPLMNLKTKDNLRIACISHNGRMIFPRGQDVIQPDDHVVIVTTHTGFGDIGDILA